MTYQRGAGTTSELKRLRVWGQRLRYHLPAVLMFVAVPLVWELIVRGFSIQQFLLPPPSAIFASLSQNCNDLRWAAWHTLYEAIGGFLIGSIMAIFVAVSTVRWAVARRALVPFAIAVSAVPTIVLAPIMNTWFGSTNPLSKMMIVVILVFFPIVINLTRGLTLVDSSALELMQSYGASEFAIFRILRIPNALPYLFTALKVSATLSLIGAIVAEYFGGPLLTLGVWILNQADRFRFPTAWAAIIVACLLGISFYLLIVALERLVIPWHVSMRSSNR